MTQDTGLKIENTTSNKITVDLFEQGQSGSSVPVKSTQIVSPNGDETVTNADGGGRNWVYTGTAFTSDDYRDIDWDDLRVNTAQTSRKLHYSPSGNDSVKESDPQTLTELISKIESTFDTKNSTSSALSCTVEAKMKGLGSDTYSLQLRWVFRYLTDPDGLSFLVESIRFTSAPS